MNRYRYQNYDSSDYSSDDDYVSLDQIIVNFQNQNQPIDIGYSSSDSDLIQLNDVVKIIKNNPCVILYSSWCGYSRKALELLKQAKRSAKKIEIEDIQGSMDDIRNRLSKESFQFPRNYSTRPMIFMNGKFIGGYDKLSKHL
jgi:glutaredoxin-related protein